MLGTRTIKKLDFASGSSDVGQVIPLNEGGAAGEVYVFAQRESGTGTATVTVQGSFKADPSANDLFEMVAATASGTGALTAIGNAETDFPYVRLFLDRTGTSAVGVYVVTI